MRIVFNQPPQNRSRKNVKVGTFLWQLFEHFALIFITPGAAYRKLLTITSTRTAKSTAPFPAMLVTVGEVKR